MISFKIEDLREDKKAQLLNQRGLIKRREVQFIN